MNDLARFHTRYLAEPLTGCWLWLGCTAASSNGYGKFTVDGALVYAHRASYILLVGPLETGMLLDHLCRTRACVNPAHLEPVTPRENTLRGIGPTSVNARRTHCPDGHAYDAENTILERGRRHCAACRVGRRAA